jgi:predicted TIM-barrel fold metal-dependent hydrolase
MPDLIDPRRYEAVDRPIFDAELADFLPEEIYDIHVHLHVPAHGVPTPEAIKESWAAEAPHELSRDQLQPLQEQLFPGHRTRSLVFANPSKWVDLEAANAHVAAAIAADRADGLLVTRPEWTPDHVRGLLAQGGFLGCKPYPGLVGGRFDENVALDDFLPPAQQALADELGLIVMLHIPRPERLRDPRNQAEVRRLVEEHPGLRLIIAHLGRAYTMSFAETGLQALRDLPVHWDFAMNLNAEVIARALEVLGPERILYGSDLPIALMRGMRRHEGDAYVNYSDGDYVWNTPARRMPPAIEEQYTLYLYEELRAFRQAATLVGLTAAQVERVMNGNARGLVAEVRAGAVGGAGY